MNIDNILSLFTLQQEKRRMTTLQGLPNENLFQICEFLSLRELERLGRTCNRFHEIIEDNYVWQNVSKRDFPAKEKQEGRSWKNHYKICYLPGTLRLRRKEAARTSYNRCYESAPETGRKIGKILTIFFASCLIFGISNAIYRRFDPSDKYSINASIPGGILGGTIGGGLVRYLISRRLSGINFIKDTFLGGCIGKAVATSAIRRFAPYIFGSSFTTAFFATLGTEFAIDFIEEKSRQVASLPYVRDLCGCVGGAVSSVKVWIKG